ncbi:MAG: hypothetical protein EZS28_019945 [Streblomastix strix]|uniref:Uncharacterized protein n=1 Tax=Streblomastix strix TaxID=222440 RepID=A0A5J4VPF5_9EUKA|nr:MAG: hypothetical protein EZS28_019945 [Streblomastix strix]
MCAVGCKKNNNLFNRINMLSKLDYYYTCKYIIYAIKQADPIAENTRNIQQGNQQYYGKAADGPENSEQLKFWLGFSAACGPFNQFAILRDAQNLWNTAIYAREQAVICSNSLTDLCTNNSVSVSPLESIIAGKRHCGVFIDIPLCEIDRAAAAGDTPYFYLIPYDITFSGVLDLNQLNPIFNSFPVLIRNFAPLYVQLWEQDFLQDLKIVQLNKIFRVTIFIILTAQISTCIVTQILQEIIILKMNLINILNMCDKDERQAVGIKITDTIVNSCDLCRYRRFEAINNVICV